MSASQSLEEFLVDLISKFCLNSLSLNAENL